MQSPLAGPQGPPIRWYIKYIAMALSGLIWAVQRRSPSADDYRRFINRGAVSLSGKEGAVLMIEKTAST